MRPLLIYAADDSVARFVLAQLGVERGGRDGDLWSAHMVRHTDVNHFVLSPVSASDMLYNVQERYITGSLAKPVSAYSWLWGVLPGLVPLSLAEVLRSGYGRVNSAYSSYARSGVSLSLEQRRFEL
jgi:hypothetical protein